MTTVKEILDTYNQIATKAGEPTLKEWKGAKDQLQKKLDALMANYLTITDIANEAGVNPKTARGKLRRKGLHKAGESWPLFKRDSKDHKKIVAALAADDASETEGVKSNA